MDSNIILKMRNITKQFPGVLALDKVDLDLKRGEVLALVGENGAGKSTLMKILSGAYHADDGDIVFEGRPVRNYNPKQAIDMGISIMYQELNYVNDLSIAENIFLGDLPRKGITKRIDYKRLRNDAEKVLKQVGLNYHPFTEIRRLSVAEKQLVEIAKAISKDIKVLVMDEPTSALNEQEIEILFDIIKKLAKQGKSIIYISHRLDEIFVISNRVMVMRDGRNVGVFNTDQTSKSQIVNYMVGREIKDMYPIKRRQIGEKVLEVENLNTEKAVNINFNIRKGEIVGLFGLMGSGRTNIVEAIFGANEKHSGTIKIDGEKVNIANPSMAIRAGIGYVPSERKTDGLVLIQSVKENISLAYIDRFRKKVSLDLKREEVYVKDWVKKLSIKTSDINNEIQTLSGGNQQKVILAKWMMTNPKVLILNEPTRGIDVGAKVEIYKLMEDFCDKGLGIVMISSELPEILAICDRVITICEGRITGEYTQSEISQEKLLLGAIGEC